MADTKALKEEILRLVASDRDFRARLWKALVEDRGNMRELNEALHELVRDGGKLP